MLSSLKKLNHVEKKRAQQLASAAEEIESSSMDVKSMKCSSCVCLYDEDSSVSSLSETSEKKRGKEEYITDKILADERRPHTVTDQVVLIFVDSMMEFIVEKWEGEICMKPVYRNSERDKKQEENDKTGENGISDKNGVEKKPTLPSISISSEGNNSKNDKDPLHNDMSTKSHRFSKMESERKRSQIIKDKGMRLTRRVTLEEDNAKKSHINGNGPQVAKQAEPSHSYESQIDDTVDWMSEILDEQVYIKFKNGNKYEGRVSKKIMEGYGKFTWADGSVYMGNFENGTVNGRGEMLWPDLSSYNGLFYYGYQHGIGMFISSSHNLTYLGNWHIGQVHGKGTVFRGQKNDNYYDGEFNKGERSGHGVRRYPSGAMYIGFWHKNNKHGIGSMVWRDTQMYRGEWKNGKMDGYGEYIWNAFLNQHFVYPDVNMYCGNWRAGKQHGLGYLYIAGSCYIKATWLNGEKNGYGFVVCKNGLTTESQSLFDQNNPAVKTHTSQSNSLTSLLGKVELFGMEQGGDLKSLRQIPIHKPSQDIDLSYHLEQWISKTYQNEIVSFRLKLLFYSNAFRRRKKSNNSINKADKSFYLNEFRSFSQQLKKRYSLEEKYLRNAIARNLPFLHELYNTYAMIACDEPPGFKPLLVRIMLWQLYRDCEIHKKGVVLVELDKSLAKNPSSLVQDTHDPFEVLYFWQFLHCLIDLAKFLYSDNANFPSNDSFATAFQKMLQTDIIPHVGKRTGSVLFELRNIAPLHAVYLLYKSIGEPLSAKNLLNLLCPRKELSKTNESPLVFFRHVIEGTNVMSVLGDPMYFPGTPLVYKPPSEIMMERKSLETLNSLPLATVLNFIVDVCPGMKSKEDMIVDVNYPINFLEFYEILLLCTKMAICKTEVKLRSKTFFTDQKEPDTQKDVILPDITQKGSVGGVSEKSTKLSGRRKKKS